MTVSTTNAYSGPLLANGATKVFPFTFKVMGSSEIAVVMQAADGSETPVAPALYSVSISGGSGGSVTFYVAPANGLRIFILSNPALDQEIGFENESAWLAEPHNEGLDRSAVRAQFLAREVSRAWREPLGEAGVVVPPALARKGAVLAFDHITGKPIVGPVIATLESVATIAGYLATVAAHVDDIEIVGASIGSVNAVAPVVAAVGVVAANIGLIEAVNDDILSVRAVGGSIDQVRDVAANLMAIGNAASNAAAALAAKNAAEAARDDAVTSKNAAAVSASTAGNAEVSAVAARDSAQSHRNAASASADAAAGHASSASGSSANATEKAASADSSAASANLSKNEAVIAKNAAEAAASGVAADRERAETAAASAEVDAAAANASADIAAGAEAAAVDAKDVAVAKALEAVAAQLAAAASQLAAAGSEAAANAARIAAEAARDQAELIVGGNFEPKITAGNINQLWRGDKTWIDSASASTPGTVVVRDGSGRVNASEVVFDSGGHVRDSATIMRLGSSATSYIAHLKASDTWVTYSGGQAVFYIYPEYVLSNKPINVSSAPTAGNHLTNKTYVDAGLELKAGTALVTTAANGLMAAADKSKLDGINLSSVVGSIAGAVAQFGVGGVLVVASPTADAHAATRGFVNTAISSALADFVGSAPEALDTIYELASALGNNPNAITELTALIGGKADASHTHGLSDLVYAPAGRMVVGRIGTSGDLTAVPLGTYASATAGQIPFYGTSGRLTVGTPSATTDAATKAYTDAQRDTRLSKAGDTFSGGFSNSGGATSLTEAVVSLNGSLNNWFTYTNSGSFTLNAPASSYPCTMVIEITNAPSGAGALLAAGFTFQDISAFTTVANARFIATVIVFSNSKKYLYISRAS